MTKNLADMAAGERANCVGMWAVVEGVNLAVIAEADETNTCVVTYPQWDGDSAVHLNEMVTPRLDLPRAWTPDGEPVQVAKEADEHHSVQELYDYRMAYNAVTFNQWARDGKYEVHKSWRHGDGEKCFGGGWFIVSATTPYGQVTNHYSSEHWNRFHVPIRERAAEWDGHTPQQALERLIRLTEITNE